MCKFVCEEIWGSEERRVACGQGMVRCNGKFGGHCRLKGGRDCAVFGAADVVAWQRKRAAKDQRRFLRGHGFGAEAGNGACGHLIWAVVVEKVAGEGWVEGETLPIRCHLDRGEERL